MNQVVVLGGVADDVDDEAAPLEVKGERLGQGQRGRASDDDDLGAGTVAGAGGAAGARMAAARKVGAVGGGADDDEDDARQQPVAGDPGLQAVETRGGGGGSSSAGRPAGRTRADGGGDPGRGREGLAQGVGGAIDAAVEKGGHVVRVAAEVRGDAGELRVCGVRHDENRFSCRGEGRAEGEVTHHV